MLQDDIIKSKNWIEIWEMLFNTTEFHHMHLEQGEPHQYTIGSGENQITIKTVENKDYLGVTTDKELKFRYLITQTVNMTNKTGTNIKNMYFHGEDTRMFLNVQKSIARPNLEYATQIWSPICKKTKLF